MATIKCIRDVMRDTNDQWYPNFPGNQVRVRVTRLTNSQWRVSVWGADDCGMEYDFSRQDEALDCFENLPVVISKKDLLTRGFINA